MAAGGIERRTGRFRPGGPLPYPEAPNGSGGSEFVVMRPFNSHRGCRSVAGKAPCFLAKQSCGFSIGRGRCDWSCPAQGLREKKFAGRLGRLRYRPGRRPGAKRAKRAEGRCCYSLRRQFADCAGSSSSYFRLLLPAAEKVKKTMTYADSYNIMERNRTLIG